MLTVLYACLICINFNKYIYTLINKYLTDLLAIRCTFVKCGAVNLWCCQFVYLRCYCFRCIGFWIYQVGVKYILLQISITYN